MLVVLTVALAAVAALRLLHDPGLALGRPIVHPGVGHAPIVSQILVVQFKLGIQVVGRCLIVDLDFK